MYVKWSVKIRMSVVTGYDLQNKICYLIPTLLDFQNLVRKFLPFTTVLSLAIFSLTIRLYGYEVIIINNFKKIYSVATP